MTAARIALESLVRQMPQYAYVHLQLGGIAYAEDRLRDTALHTLDAAQNLPDDTDFILRVVLTLLQVGEVVAARRCLEHPAIARCTAGAALARFASARQMVGDHTQALELLNRAKALGHDDADFRYIRSVQLLSTARPRKPRARSRPACAWVTTYGRASVTLARLRKQTAQSNHLD